MSASRCPVPRRRPPDPAREANESAAAAVSCFVAQVCGRAQLRSMLAFREHSPSRPSRPRGRCLAPPRLLTKGFRIAIERPGRPPCHLAGASPGGSWRRRFEAQPGGAAPRACVRCCCGAVAQQSGGKPGTERPPPATRHPGSRRGSGGARPAPRAQAQARAHLPRGDPGRTAESHVLCLGAACQAWASWAQGDLGQALPLLNV